MGHLKDISNAIERHRAEAVSCCPEDCWCWSVDAAICEHEEHDKSLDEDEEEGAWT